MSVTAVIPTYRRRDALLRCLPLHAELADVEEIIVVDDGSDDATAEAVTALALDRVRIVRHEKNRGLPAARNTGAHSATSEWIVFLEDDCGFPHDYVTALLGVAREYAADIVGAPWISTEGDVVARAAADQPVERVRFGDPPWARPSRPIETPFLPALALVRRCIFEQVRYDVGYSGNFYREETDFFVTARRSGFRVMLTPTTESWQVDRWDGGCRLPRLRYDVYAAWNTWRFLRKHGPWLRAEGLLAQAPISFQARFMWPLLRHEAKRPLLWLRDSWRRRRGRA